MPFIDIIGDIFGGGGEEAALQAANISAGATTQASTLQAQAIREAAARLGIAGPEAGEIQAQGALTAADLQALGITGLAGERELACIRNSSMQAVDRLSGWKDHKLSPSTK